MSRSGNHGPGAWLGGLLGAALLGMTGVAAACAPRHQVMFHDGSRACLSETRLGERRPAGRLGSLASLTPTSGWYHVAVPRQPSMCPSAVGLEYVSSAGSTSGGLIVPPVGSTPQSRAAEAVRACQRLAGVAAQGSPCECIAVVSDGRGLVSRAEFERMAQELPLADSATAVAPAPAPTPTRPPTGTRPEPSRADAPSAADLAALRAQIEALQSQVARQGERSPPAQSRPPQQAAAQNAPATPAAQRPAATPRARTRALVIGNGSYRELGVLANPRRDAEAIASKFRAFGIEVDVALDTDRNGLVRALGDYLQRAAGYDVNILFYAGHGLQVGGVNYIVPVDMAAAGATVGSVKLNAVSLNDALEYLPARTRVVFLDACRDNPLARSLMATRGSAGVGLAPVSTISGTLVAYATRDGSTAEDGSGRNSPYTTALLQHLDAEEDIAVVLRRVRQSVLRATNNRQEPWEYGSLIGDALVLSRLAR